MILNNVLKAQLTKLKPLYDAQQLIGLLAIITAQNPHLKNLLSHTLHKYIYLLDENTGKPPLQFTEDLYCRLSQELGVNNTNWWVLATNDGFYSIEESGHHNPEAFSAPDYDGAIDFVVIIKGVNSSLIKI
jgi:hypothetical protein